jgi:hypothetical protein
MVTFVEQLGLWSNLVYGDITFVQFLQNKRKSVEKLGVTLIRYSRPA